MAVVAGVLVPQVFKHVSKKKPAETSSGKKPAETSSGTNFTLHNPMHVCRVIPVVYAVCLFIPLHLTNREMLKDCCTATASMVYSQFPGKFTMSALHPTAKNGL